VEKRVVRKFDGFEILQKRDGKTHRVELSKAEIFELTNILNEKSILEKREKTK
jgi:hypothetical protein